MIVANLFRILYTTPDSTGSLNCTVALDADNPIYGMHFPGNPVTPGVCLIKACKELMEIHSGRRMFLRRLVNVKFLAVISPAEHSIIRFTFTKIDRSDSVYICTGTIQGMNGETFAKLKLEFDIAPATLDQRMEQAGICLVIPTYNHAPFLRQVLDEALSRCANVIVVDDGSTDNTPEVLASFDKRIDIITLPRNRGKGQALWQGMKQAIAAGYRYALTMDSDGQHSPADIEGFVDAIETNPGAMIAGARTLREENMPSGNRFANRFSNFWFRLQTGFRLPDTQCGFRLYPLDHICRIPPAGARYETELAWLLRLSWRNVPIISIPVTVDYLPRSQRPSHYRRFTDFMRISLLNSVMCFVAVSIWARRRFSG
jgi:3-hydroxymyristoyl/3-hydroxydecanoyl-(acyl carrier protein) dehydratase